MQACWDGVSGITPNLIFESHPSLPRFADPWLGFAAFERGHRCVREARTLFKRSYSRAFEDGGAVLVCNEWLRFEREEGR